MSCPQGGSSIFGFLLEKRKSESLSLLAMFCYDNFDEICIDVCVTIWRCLCFTYIRICICRIIYRANIEELFCPVISVVHF
jgi:hypothetical protein